MKKILLVTTNKTSEIIFKTHVRTDFEIVVNKPMDEIPTYCSDPKNDVYALVLDSKNVGMDTVRVIRAAVKDDVFPIIILGRCTNKKNLELWMQSGATDVLDLALPLMVVIMRIKTVIQLYSTMRSLAKMDHDELTGLYNRMAFYHYAQVMIDEQPDARYSLLLSDIDDFKMINSRYGEKKGDELLAFIGHTLGRMNNSDRLFARYGGDQFVGLFRHTTDFDENNTDPIAGGMQEMYKNAPVDHFVVKFGLYDNVNKMLPISMMCDRALMALRTIKHQYGKEIAVYNTDMQHQYERQQQIAAHMEGALRGGQFKAYYQPKHDAATGKLVGAEALVRWIHPEYGFMSPGDFIPLFEENGFISKVDANMWNQVCRDQVEWKNQGIRTVPVSINASRKDVLNPNFLNVVRNGLNQPGVEPSMFHMEVTESAYIEDAELMKPIVQEVQDMGVKIELDDFGSGYSSLGILSKVPLNVIKLDMSFIRNINSQKVIVESMIRLAHDLGFTTVAEGVETEDQLNLLRSMKCDAIQGYYYSRPLPKADFEAYLKKYEN